MKEVNAFKCEFCGKLYQRKHACEKHEERCHKNPVNHRDCLVCHLLETRGIERNLFDCFGGDYFTGFKSFYCPKLNKYLYPPISEHKKNFPEQEDLQDKEGNEVEFGPMLKKCEVFMKETEELEKLFKNE